MMYRFIVVIVPLVATVIIVCALGSDDDTSPNIREYYNSNRLSVHHNKHAASSTETKHRSCPCQNITNCRRIKKIPDKEVFIFSVSKKNWLGYDWSRVTSIVEFNGHDDDLMCYAHSKGVRLLSVANIPVSDLTNDTARHIWVQGLVDAMATNFLDGINVDFESPIEADRTDLRDGFTRYMTDLNTAVKNMYSSSLVTIDYAWSSQGIDGRFYDYRGIADVTDFMFVMSYDERSQIYDDCVAWANSGYNNTLYGIDSYMKLGIPANKLILGVPWYGYRYPCMSYNKTTQRCALRHVPFRGMNCSDAAGSQVDYSQIVKKYLPMSISGRLWDKTAQSPYFIMKDPDSDQMIQFWYDDRESLVIKYELAQELGLRGVGMWNADGLDYSDPDMVKDMWSAIPRLQAMVAKW